MIMMMMMMMMIYRNVNRTATMWFSSNRVAFNRNCPHNRDNIAPGMQEARPILPATFWRPAHIPYSYQLSVGCVWIDKNIWHCEAYISVILEWDKIWRGGEEKDLIYLISENLVTNFKNPAVGTEGIWRNISQNTSCPDPGLNQAPPNINLSHCRDTTCCMCVRI